VEKKRCSAIFENAKKIGLAVKCGGKWS
jgi:hypothetical protein